MSVTKFTVNYYLFDDEVSTLKFLYDKYCSTFCFDDSIEDFFVYIMTSGFAHDIQRKFSSLDFLLERFDKS